MVSSSINKYFQQYKIKHHIDAPKDHKALRRLRSCCERAKRRLSSEIQYNIIYYRVTIEVDSLFNGEDFNVILTRAKFENICDEIFKKTLQPVRAVLRDSKLQLKDIQDVVLVGGSTRIPKIQQMLKEFFLGKRLYDTLNQDEAVAYGATIQVLLFYYQASILCGYNKDISSNIVLLDVVPLSVGVETAGGMMDIIISRNATIPVRKTQLYTTNIDDQDGVDIQVFEGERPLTKVYIYYIRIIINQHNLLQQEYHQCRKVHHKFKLHLIQIVMEY